MRAFRKLLIPLILMSGSVRTKAQSLLQELPKLGDPSISFLQSTYDRTGLNDDHITPLFHNYYDVIPQGKVNNPGGTATSRKEYVICHVAGPAIVERFWMITFPFYLDARFRFYFDGETTPRINRSFNELFFAQTPPFVKPLVQNIYESSGGFWSYIDLPVSRSLIVTIDTAAVFCQFGIRQLPRDTVVQSWTAAQDNSYLVNEFSRSGSYPKDNFAQTLQDSVSDGIQPGQTLTLFSKSGNYVIEGVKMQIPSLDYTYSSFVKDKGNFHKGISKFTLKINGNADTVLLIKRSNKSYHLDFNFNNLAENASVKIDNQAAGSWQNKGYRSYRFWKNDTFRIAKNLYQGKSQVTVQAQYTAGEPWNEYYYWINCDHVMTDSLDVGDTASELAHTYSVTGLQSNLYSEINNRYDAPPDVKKKNRQILDSLYIKIYFDDETSPSIYAPAGLFFATGVNDAVYMRSIPCGNVNGEFYNYLSMPFRRNARIELENKSHVAMPAVVLKTQTAPNTYPEAGAYLKTYLNKATKGYADPADYLVAAVSGKGRYVGTVIEADQDNDTVFCWLEGDERIYVDESKTPVFYGTGTEDYFNSTFYFFLDEYSLQQSGMTNSDVHFHRSMYRFHLTDPINFEKNIRFSIEHGDYNNKLGNYQSLAFYYLKPSECVLSDSLDPGNTISEQQHQYTTTNAKIQIRKNSAFEGEQYQVLLSQDGYSINDSVEFNVSVDPRNKGVRLLRTFDYSIMNQQARVFVNDSLAGVWLNAGFNTVSQFRDDYFVIPAKLTLNRSSLHIKIVNDNPASRWSELYYKVYSVYDTSVLSYIKPDLSDIAYTIYPTITPNKVMIRSCAEISSFIIYSASGQPLQAVQKEKGSVLTTLDLSAFSAGTYFIAILQKDKILKTEKVILVR